MSVFFALYFVLPTLVLVYRAFGKQATKLDFAAGIGLSILAVAWAVFGLSTLTLGFYQHPVWILVNLLFLKNILRDQNEFRVFVQTRLLQKPALSVEGILVLVLVGVGFFASLILYTTETFSNGCLHRNIANVIQLTVGSFDFPRFPPIFLEEPEREGAVALAASFAHLWGFLGLRLFYATTTALCGVFGWAIARTTLPDHRVPRLLVPALFMAFPLMADILWNDINTMSFFAAAALLYLCVRTPKNAWIIGFFFGILVAVRHIAVLCLPGVLLFVYAGPNKTSDRLWPFVKAFALASIPWIAFHTVASGSPWAFETFTEYGKHPHRFLGLEFELNAMLNYPFIERIVRTPFNPLPTFLLFPLWLLSRLGLILAALAAIGGVAVAIRSRLLFLRWAGWVVPYALLLAVSENWLQVEKMGTVAPLMPIVFLAMAFGWVALGKPDRRIVRIVAFVLTLGALYAAAPAVNSLNFPADERYYKEYPWLLSERPEHLEAERELLSVGLLPGPEWIRLSFAQSPLAQLREDFFRRAYKDRFLTAREQVIGQMMPQQFDLFLRQCEVFEIAPTGCPGPTTLYRIDLSAPWVKPGQWLHTEQLRPQTGLVLDLCPQDGLRQYTKFPMPYSPDYAASLIAFQRANVVYVVLFGPNKFEIFDPENPGAPSGAITAIAQPPLENSEFFVVAPKDATVRIVEYLTMDPRRVYLWQLNPGDNPDHLQGPIHWRGP